MPIPIIALLSKAATSRILLKAVGQMAGKAILNKLGIFKLVSAILDYKKGIAKGLTKAVVIKEMTKKILKREAVEMLNNMDLGVLYDIFRKGGGVKMVLKKWAINNFTPESIRKIYYLTKNFKYLKNKVNITQKSIVKDTKKEIWKELGTRGKHNDLWKIEQIENILNADVPKKFKKELLDNNFRFRTHSSQSHNFDRRQYDYNPATQVLICNVRSGGNRKIYYYMAFDVPVEIVKKAIKTSSYGKMIFWTYFKHR